MVNKTGTLIPIHIDPMQNLVPTVEAQSAFVIEIGVVTRTKAALNVKGWKKVTVEIKKNMAEALTVSYLVIFLLEMVLDLSI